MDATSAGSPSTVTPDRRALSAIDAAWLAAIPTAGVALLAILLLGPALGDALLSPGHVRFWALFQTQVHPEPTEAGRFLVALTMPLLLVALTVVAHRRWPRRATAASEAAAIASQALFAGFAVACLLQQHGLFGPLYPEPNLVLIDYFPIAALVVAAAGTVAIVATVRNADLRARFVEWTRDTRRRRIAAGVLAAIATVVWLLPALNTEDTIRGAHVQVLFHAQFTLDETYAVLDGRSPLVDFVTQYGALWPYAFAAAMSLVGSSVGVWMTLAVGLSALGMLSIYGVLRRAAQSAIYGLLLFLPLLALSFFPMREAAAKRYSFGDYYGTFPLRYAGPSLLAWLVARHLGGSGPRPWAVFVAAGLVALNNLDTGVGALLATVAALLWAAWPLTRARATRLAVEAAGGLVAAFALVSVLTLARTGSLPNPGLLTRFTRLFGVEGFSLFPMPTIGLHVTIFLTFVAALAVATTRALRGEPHRLLTGMLAWSAVFGFGASSYFVGRSAPDQLVALFFPWAFALALLLVPALASLRSASWRRPPFAAVACVFGFLAVATTLTTAPAPWRQLDRLGQTTAPILARPHGEAFIAAHTHHGERVAIFGLLGHRIGVNLGIDNVSPYTNSLVMLTAESLDESIAALRDAGGRKLFVDLQLVETDVQQSIEAAGFRLAGVERSGRTALWVDERPRPG